MHFYFAIADTTAIRDVHAACSPEQYHCTGKALPTSDGLNHRIAMCLQQAKADAYLYFTQIYGTRPVHIVVMYATTLHNNVTATVQVQVSCSLATGQWSPRAKIIDC